MKKVLLLFVVLCLGVSSSLFAQKGGKKIQKKLDAYITAIETTVTLTGEEKAKILELKKESFAKSSEVAAEYKGTPEFKTKKKEVNKAYTASLVEAFGKTRAKEIEKAAKANRKKKKKKE